MTAEIPADLAPFVQRMVAERKFLTMDDVPGRGTPFFGSAKPSRRKYARGSMNWTQVSVSRPRRFTAGLKKTFARLRNRPVGTVNGASDLFSEGRR